MSCSRLTRLITTFVAALLSMASHSEIDAEDKTLYFVSGDNCPFSCASHDKPGIWVEMIRALLESSGYTVQHQLRPIKRAHHEVRRVDPQSNQYLFTVRTARSLDSNPAMPGLLTSHRPILFYRGCFITRSNVEWQYSGPQSSPSIKLGLVDGLNYSFLSEFLNRTDQKPLTIYTVGKDPTLSNLKLLVSGRIDALLSTYTLAYYSAAKEGLTDKIEMAGCDVTPHPFYLVFPDKHHLSKILIKLIDDRLDTVNANGTVARIYANYEINLQNLLTKPTLPATF
jgi:hypothetical protein